MKKSTTLKLGLMAASAPLVAACGDPNEEASFYNSVGECTAAGVFTEEECERAYTEATEIHDEAAPRYDSRALCEEQHGVGNCEDRGSFFGPFLTGYLIANMLDNDSRSYSRPVYRTTNGGIALQNGTRINRTSDGFSINRQQMTAPPRTPQVVTRTTSISRQGFGTSSRSFGG